MLIEPLGVSVSTSMINVPSARPWVLMPLTLKAPPLCTAAVAVTLVPLVSRTTKFSTWPGANPWVVPSMLMLLFSSSMVAVTAIGVTSGGMSRSCRKSSVKSLRMAMTFRLPGLSMLVSILASSNLSPMTTAMAVVMLPSESEIKMLISVPSAMLFV